MAEAYPLSPASTLRLYLLNVLGLATSIAAVALSLWIMGRPVLQDAPIVGLVASALATIELALAGWSRARLPTRDRGQPFDAFWADDRVRRLAVSLWLSLGSAGMLAVIGFFLTASKIAGTFMVVAMIALVWMRPSHLAASGAV
jgi:small-conductance mechanosensitive channel